jgi:hypothetical protein
VDKLCYICLLKKNEKGKFTCILDISRRRDMLVVCVYVRTCGGRGGADV